MYISERKQKQTGDGREPHSGDEEKLGVSGDALETTDRRRRASTRGGRDELDADDVELPRSRSSSRRGAALMWFGWTWQGARGR